MRAVVLTGTGGPEVLQVQERPDPPVGPGEVRIAVKRRRDQLRRHDGPGRPLPRRAEAALRARLRGRRRGRVRGGGGRASSQVGDRVIAGTRFGGQAELVTVPADQALPLPERLSFEQGAAFPVNYGTAYAALVMMGGLREGDRVLIHAAAGGVGISATQIARNVGAEIFGTASASKHDAIRAQGVDHAIDYRTQDFEAEVMRITGGEGVDLIMDALGPDLLPQGLPPAAPGRAADHVRRSRRAPTREGRSIPATAEEPGEDAAGDDALVEEPVGDEREQRRLRPQHAALVGTRGNLDRVIEPLMADLEAGRLEPVVAEAFPFDRAGEAHEFIAERRNIGKVVLFP